MSGDIFNIDEIGNFNTQVFEVSEIGDIIRKITNLKNENVEIKIAKREPYSVYDKITKNNIKGPVAVLIEEMHSLYYDVIEEALSILSIDNLDIKKDLFELYRIKYLLLLAELNLELDNVDKIIEKAEEIFIKMNQVIHKEIFYNRTSNIPSEKQIIYLKAISAYVFYKCKFLIAME